MGWALTGSLGGPFALTSGEEGLRAQALWTRGVSLCEWGGLFVLTGGEEGLRGQALWTCGVSLREWGVRSC